MFHTLRHRYFKIVCRHTTDLPMLLEQDLIKPFRGLHFKNILDVYQATNTPLSMIFDDKDIILKTEVIEWLDENEIIYVQGSFGIRFLEIYDHMAFKMRWL